MFAIYCTAFVTFLQYMIWLQYNFAMYQILQYIAKLLQYCNATIAHTREIVFYSRYEKEYYWNRKYYLNNISYTILSTRIELVWLENRHANDIITQD